MLPRAWLGRVLARVLCAGLLLIAVGRLSALSVRAPDFDELVAEAQSIQRVQVIAVRSQWDDTPGGRVIHTYVRCQVLRALKGGAATFELRLLGGQVGDAVLDVGDLPAFQVGERCLLFVTGNGRQICPLVGVGYGCYRILSDPATGEERVYRNDHQPLAGLADVPAPFSARQASAAAGDASALSVSAFEQAIIDQLRAHPDAK